MPYFGGMYFDFPRILSPQVEPNSSPLSLSVGAPGDLLQKNRVWKGKNKTKNNNNFTVDKATTSVRCQGQHQEG